MSAGTKAWTIVGYTYQADQYHPACILHEFEGDRDPYLSVEDRLDQVAGVRGIDRQDETTFDSDDFPKVIFASQIEGPEPCGTCGQTL